MPAVHTQAFGIPLTVELDPPLAGLEAGAAAAGTPTRVEHARPADVAGTGPSTRVLEQRLPDGTLSVSCDRYADGYVLETAIFGRFAVAADGLAVRVDTAGVVPWRWQRLLLGHAIPLAVVSRGVELLHASGAVSPDGRAVAIHAQSHGGKTSVAVQLARRGWSLLTDDALAITVDGDVPVAHPGSGTATVRTAEARLIDADGGGWPGAIAARDEDSVRLVLPRGAPAPLAAVYLLAHGAGAPATRFEPIVPTTPELLATTFNFALRDPDRLARLLHVFSIVAARTAFVRAHVGDGVGAAQLAGEIEADLSRRA